MALPISIPNTFANANAAIPLSQLDNNFTTVSDAINGIGNGAESLANVSITGGAVDNVAITNSSMNSANVTITGGTITNVAINFEDQLATRPTLKDYSINGEVLGTVSANATLDLANANFFSATANANLTFSFANASPANTLSGAVLALTNGGAYTLGWSNVDWSGGSPPTLTSNGLDILVFVTYDAGTTIHGMPASLDSQ
jgi:hypothetical protein